MSRELTIIKEETLDAVSKRIKSLQANGEIHFPLDYSPQNALKSAWLILQETRDKDKNLALEVCTKTSILNSLMDMVITGMNPVKKQGYFIVYGKQLAFQRSYFGSMALAKRVNTDIEDIIAEPVYESDELEYEIIKGRKHIIKHKQTIDAVNSKKVKAVYCMVIDKNGEVKKTDLMTFEEVKKSWEKSKMEPVNKDGSIKAGSVHDEFTAEMVRKTIINRTCKPIINSSDDKHLKIAAMRSEIVEAEEEALVQIEEHANQEIIDIEPDTKEEEKENKSQGSVSTWDPCTSEIQKRYGADKAKILEEECGRRNINISGFTYQQAHDVLLKAIKEQAQEQVKESKEERKAPPFAIKHCPKTGEKVDVTYCEKECEDSKENENGKIPCDAYADYKMSELAPAEGPEF
ncbi:MAG: recombinase RecT [Candidatus Atribacteria bacterium]|nr:recombinase RecT [Candidatus Atribacteria bacterium]